MSGQHLTLPTILLPFTGWGNGVVVDVYWSLLVVNYDGAHIVRSSQLSKQNREATENPWKKNFNHQYILVP